MPMRIGDWESSELEAQRLAESRRQLDELFERKKESGFKNGLEMLEALAALFGSDEQLEEFGRYIRRIRDEKRAGYRD
jgi:hypothetical protein